MKILDERIISAEAVTAEAGAASPHVLCMHELFEEQVDRQGCATAVVSRGETFSYLDLDRRANRLARLLRDRGVCPDSLVGIGLERGDDMIVALLGILKAGGAYLPLSIDDGSRRSQRMPASVGARIIITLSRYAQRWDAGDARVICLDEVADELAARADTRLASVNSPHDLAYCLFTSGSTGEPKAIGTEHRNVVRLVKRSNFAQLDETQRLLGAAPLSFDASTLEIWGSLLNGGVLVLMQPGPITLDGLAEAIETHGVTVLWLTAALFERMSRTHLRALRGVRHILAGGDVLSSTAITAVLKALPGCRLTNGYGPTECTTFATCHDFSPEFANGPPPIGRPIGETQAYVLDDALRPVERGAVGELYVAGAGLARGYLNRPDLTAERFLADPFGSPGSRMYKTGDMVRQREDGVIEFAGRRDHQVKIRGHRVELAEVERSLRDCEGVQEAVVVVAGDSAATKRLVAYVAGDVAALSSVRLREQLQGYLPDYMIPASFVALHELPLQPNGKVDRSALPEPTGLRQGLGVDYVAPSTPMQRLTAEVWSGVLGIESIGLDDDFLMLGGTSINAIDVSFALCERLGDVHRVAPPLRNITLRDFAAQVDALVAARTGEILAPSLETIAEDVPSYAQEQVWFLEQLGDGWRAYRFHGRITFRGPLDRDRLQRAVDALIERQDIYRTAFVERDGSLRRIMAPAVKMPLRFVDLSSRGAEEALAAQRELEAVELGAHFDVAKPPLVRWLLMRLPADEHALFISEHHNVHDGQSFRIMLAELGRLYKADDARENMPPPPGVEASYARFCREERAWLKSPDFTRQVEAWCHHLRDHLAGGHLFADRRPAGPRTFGGDQLRVQIDQGLLQAINVAASCTGLSTFAFMLTAFGLQCAAASGERHFLVGTALANRPARRFQSTVGMFVNTVPLPFDARLEQTFAELAHAQAENVRFALNHGRIPLAEIVKRLQRSSSVVGDVPFNVAFSFHDSLPLRADFIGMEARVEEGLGNGSSKFDLNVIVLMRNETSPAAAEVIFEYHTGLFTAEFMASLTDGYLALLERAAANPGLGLEAMLPAAKRPPGALASPLTEVPVPSVPTDHVEPEGPLETMIAGIWADVLGLERVGRDDHFFLRGGYSLLAIKVVTRLRQQLSLSVQLRSLFEHPVLREFAAEIAAANARSGLVAVRRTGTQRPLFVVHPVEGEVGYALAIARHLDPAVPVYGLAATGFAEGERASEDVAEMARAYLALMRSVQAAPPYRLCGWSAGGIIAYEMASQLLKQGAGVELLALLDTRADYHSLAGQSAAGRPAFTDEMHQRLAFLDEEARERHIAVRAGIARAIERYVPEPLPIPVHLYAATRESRDDESLGWASVQEGRLRCLPVDATHYSIVESPQIRGIAEDFCAVLAGNKR